MLNRPKRTMSAYRAEILELATEQLPVETLDIAQANGRILRKDITAQSPVPAFNNSAMDGIAIQWADIDELDLPVRLTSVGDLPAGSSKTVQVERGTYARIMTGAPIPDGADTVVPVEQITVQPDNVVVIEQTPSKGLGAHIRKAGEDVTLGDVVVTAGTRLTAAHLAAANAIGVATVTVSRPVRVAIAATGDELVSPPAPLERGQIYESNAVYLEHWLTELGADVTACHHIPDDPAIFDDVLDRMAETADLVVLTGGVSVGDFDVVRDGLVADGHAQFRFVAMQPGKPQGFTRWRGKTPTIGFPGNPVSTVVSAQLFLRPLLEQLTGETPQRPVVCRAAHSWRAPAKREQFMPVVASVNTDGQLVVGRTHELGSASHAVTAVAGASGLVQVGADVDDVQTGDTLMYWPLIPGPTVMPV